MKGSQNWKLPAWEVFETKNGNMSPSLIRKHSYVRVNQKPHFLELFNSLPKIGYWRSAGKKARRLQCPHGGHTYVIDKFGIDGRP